MILARKTNRWDAYETNSFTTVRQLLEMLDSNEFKDDLINLYKIDTDKTVVLKVGNTKSLLEDINALDAKCQKIDITALIKDIHLKKMLAEEKAVFEIFNISDDFIIRKNRTDILEVETRYASKADLLDIYSFSRFANYCRDKEFDDLIDIVKNYLYKKNINNESIELRLLFNIEENIFYLRAVTSQIYKNFGINFSVFVALMALNKYVEDTKNEIFIDYYVVDDSNLHVSFALNTKYKINNDIKLSFNLILENNEVKQGAVYFNGVFKLSYEKNGKHSQIYLRPNGVKKDNLDHYVDLLSYPHKGDVKDVLEKIEELPTLINHFIEQVKKDSEIISRIQHPNDIKELIMSKVKYAKNKEFQSYKNNIRNKLASITVDSMFRLFELLREVEELFEHDDIVSKNYWRTKLYEAMTKKD